MSVLIRCVKDKIHVKQEEYLRSYIHDIEICEGSDEIYTQSDPVSWITRLISQIESDGRRVVFAVELDSYVGNEHVIVQLVNCKYQIGIIFVQAETKYTRKIGCPVPNPFVRYGEIEYVQVVVKSKPLFKN
jgi:hypothetical protein